MGYPEYVLLIPGYFGFNHFGEPPVISYFDGVVRAMMKAAPGRWDGNQFLVTKPPPTGSLHERAASLHETIRRHVPVVGGVRQWQSVKIHLVGHSCGGLDACLYVNPEFHWRGAPDDAERAAFLESIGSVVTVSAPLRATPLAARTDALQFALINLVYWLSILGKRSAQGGAEALQPFLDAARRAHATSDVAALSTAFSEWLSGLHANTVDLAILEGLGLNEQTRDEVRRFMRKLADDRQLQTDLSPGPRWKERFARYLANPQRAIHSFVTVSPPPSFHFADPVRRLIYACAYRMSLDSEAFPPADYSREKWIGPAKGYVDHTKCLNDGVVPAISQVLPDARPEGVIEADHLDIVGHFDDSPNGAVIFKSGADFNKDDFEAFWATVAGLL